MLNITSPNQLMESETQIMVYWLVIPRGKENAQMCHEC